MPDVPTPPVLEILSLGAGVQSTTVLLMSLFGDLPRFDHVIFSDTGWEPVQVYEHLEKLSAFAAERGTIIETVRAGNIRQDHLDPQHEHLFIRNPVKRPDFMGRQRTFIPFFVVGSGGERGKTFRTCTKTYKIEPVEKRVREHLGLRSGQRWPLEHRVNQHLGISWDEVQRMRTSDRPAIVNKYPLIDMRMTRDDCHEWMADHGWTAPRSACIGCPFHRNDEWRRMRDTDPTAWEDAIEFDETFRARAKAGLTPLDGVPYLHDSRMPLRDAPIDPAPGVEIEEPPSLFDTMFGDNCDGFCGT